MIQNKGKTQSPKGSTEDIKLGNTEERRTCSPSPRRGVTGAERRHLGGTAELNQNHVHRHTAIKVIQEVSKQEVSKLPGKSPNIK